MTPSEHQEIVDAVARAMMQASWGLVGSTTWENSTDAERRYWRHLATTAIAATTPFIRTKALEEAAQVALSTGYIALPAYWRGRNDAAVAIRALITQAQQSESRATLSTQGTHDG